MSALVNNTNADIYSQLCYKKSYHRLNFRYNGKLIFRYSGKRYVHFLLNFGC